MFHETLYLDLKKFVNFTQDFTAGNKLGESNAPAEMIFYGKSPGAPLHVHPFSDEHFFVEEGVFELFYHHKWHRLQQGESFVMEKGIPHKFRTRTSEKTKVIFRLAPWKDFLQYSVCMVNVIENGKAKAGKNPRFLIYNAMAMKKYRAATKYKSPFVKLFISSFAFTGKVFGFRLPK